MGVRLLWFTGMALLACSDAQIDSDTQVLRALMRWESDWVELPLAGLPSPCVSVPILARVSASDLVIARRRALCALAAIGPKARSVVPAIEKALIDTDSAVRIAAACALSRVAPETPGAAVALLSHIPGSTPGTTLRSAILRACNDARTSYPDQLGRIVIRGPARVRYVAFDEILRLESLLPGAARELDVGLRGSAHEPRVLAAVLFGYFGFEVPDQPSLLRAGLRHPNDLVVSAAVKAVRVLGLGDPTLVDPLLDLLSEGTRFSLMAAMVDAVDLIHEWDLDGKDVVPTLINVVQRPNHPAREGAALALAKFPKFAEQSVPVLVGVMDEQTTHTYRDPDRVLTIHGHVWAVRALGDLGPAASIALPALRAMIAADDVRPVIAEEAAESIRRILLK